MTAIITGDIINSREVGAENWMPPLKAIFNEHGKEPKKWEIYRGDSFQLEIAPKEALVTALLIKSVVKQFSALDVRMAIGIGEKSYDTNKITESNGTAFVNSGECFESLKKQTLGIRTPWEDFDEIINIMLDLASLTTNTWGPKSVEVIKVALGSNSDLSQKELAKRLSKKQSNISRTLKRGGMPEIEKLLHFYKQEISKRC